MTTAPSASASPSPREPFAVVGPATATFDPPETALAEVRIERFGYEGPIVLTVEGLPPDMKVAPATIRTGEDRAFLHVTTQVRFFEADATLRASAPGASVEAPLHFRIGDTTPKLGKLDARYHGRGYAPLGVEGQPVAMRRSGPKHVMLLDESCTLRRYAIDSGAMDPASPIGALVQPGRQCSAFVDGQDGGLYVYARDGDGHVFITRVTDEFARDPAFDISLTARDAWSIDPSGRVVVVSGDGVVRRILGSGAPDPSFPPAAIPIADAPPEAAWPNSFSVVATSDMAFVLGVEWDRERSEQRAFRARVTPGGVAERAAVDVATGGEYLSAGWMQRSPSGDVIATLDLYSPDSWSTRMVVERWRFDPGAGSSEVLTIGYGDDSRLPALDAKGALVAVASSPVHGGPPVCEVVRIEHDGVHSGIVLPRPPPLTTSGWCLTDLVPIGDDLAMAIASDLDSSRSVLARVWIRP